MKNKPYFIVTDVIGPSGLFLMPTSKHFAEHLYRPAVPSSAHTRTYLFPPFAACQLRVMDECHAPFTVLL